MTTQEIIDKNREYFTGIVYLDKDLKNAIEKNKSECKELYDTFLAPCFEQIDSFSVLFNPSKYTGKDGTVHSDTDYVYNLFDSSKSSFQKIYTYCETAFRESDSSKINFTSNWKHLPFTRLYAILVDKIWIETKTYSMSGVKDPSKFTPTDSGYTDFYKYENNYEETESSARGSLISKTYYYYRYDKVTEFLKNFPNTIFTDSLTSLKDYSFKSSAYINAGGNLTFYNELKRIFDANGSMDSNYNTIMKPYLSYLGAFDNSPMKSYWGSQKAYENSASLLNTSTQESILSELGITSNRYLSDPEVYQPVWDDEKQKWVIEFVAGTYDEAILYKNANSIQTVYSGSTSFELNDYDESASYRIEVKVSYNSKTYYSAIKTI